MLQSFQKMQALLMHLLEQWQPMLFIVLPLAGVAYNHLPDPFEIVACFMSKYFDKTTTAPKCWSWAHFEAEIEKDEKQPARSKRPMTRSKAYVLYAIFGHERVPYKGA
eukprot:TRINITY_DN6049_c0_g1_i2.p1 TRINITY_DN6049_c0_g1~~TRINITY_DN6049_c0_g1_i2.p1  ORF type:complete len:108 (+),score=18.00 TRINITY_DN6049_c0_g1_i2:63-386(+)